MWIILLLTTTTGILATSTTITLTPKERYGEGLSRVREGIYGIVMTGELSHLPTKKSTNQMQSMDQPRTVEDRVSAFLAQYQAVVSDPHFGSTVIGMAIDNPYLASDLHARLLPELVEVAVEKDQEKRIFLFAQTLYRHFEALAPLARCLVGYGGIQVRRQFTRTISQHELIGRQEARLFMQLLVLRLCAVGLCIDLDVDEPLVVDNPTELPLDSCKLQSFWGLLAADPFEDYW